MLISKAVKDTTELKLLSWNVYFPYFAHDSSYVVETLKSFDQLDVICIQEYVQGGKDKATQWLKSKGYSIDFLPFSHDDNLHLGVMTAVRKGLSYKTKPVVLREDGPIPSRPFENLRGMLATTVNNQVTIYNIHLTFPRPHTVDMRKREFAKLQEFLAQVPKNQNWFMCGDFNFLPGDSRRKYLKQEYKSFTGSVVSKTWRNHRKFTPVRANLDYLFWNGKNIDVQARLMEFNHSDHRPMLATISLD